MVDTANASRRGVLLGGALGIAALAGCAKTQETAAGPPEVWKKEYTATKGPVSLAMYRKRVGEPVAGEAAKPVVFLVHGSSLSSMSTYDLVVPGSDMSMMNVLARAGFDVWTMDHEGYGKSTKTDSNSDVASGAEDLKAGMAVIAKETGQSKAHFFGESSGALRAGMLANSNPELIDRLVLGAFTYTGVGSPTLIERAKQLEYFKTHNRRPRDRAMLESIFTRDGAPSASPEAIEAVVKQELQYGDSAPTGTYLDMTSKLPLVDPLKIKSPTLMVRGLHDGIATDEDVLNFYRMLPLENKQFAIVPGAHALASGLGHKEMWHVVTGFLTMPI